MTIEVNDKTFEVSECKNKWVVKSKNGKLSVSYDIPKELCATLEEVRKYATDNNFV